MVASKRCADGVRQLMIAKIVLGFEILIALIALMKVTLNMKFHMLFEVVGLLECGSALVTLKGSGSFMDALFVSSESTCTDAFFRTVTTDKFLFHE